MPNSIAFHRITREADALDIKKYCFVKATATGCALSGAGGQLFGVADDDAEVVGAGMAIVKGLVNVRLAGAGAIATGTYVKSDAAGKAVAGILGTDTHVALVTRGGSVAGELIQVEVL